MMETVYAEHMLNGKAISRATRGHLLISGVLQSRIVSNIYECTISNKGSSTGPEKQLSHFPDDSKLSNLVVSEPVITELINRHQHTEMVYLHQEQHACGSNMVDLLLKFIQAERMGNFHFIYNRLKKCHLTLLQLATIYMYQHICIFN